MYGISFVYVIFFLPESVSSVVEKKEILATFEMVEQYRIHQEFSLFIEKERGISLLDYEETQNIQKQFLHDLHQQGMPLVIFLI